MASEVDIRKIGERVPRVFISSRLEELKEERIAVEEAVKELWNNEDILYKTWRWETASKDTPSGYSPDEVQSKELRKSDVYLLILGAEYGHQEGISPTHKEYEEALFEFDKDCILVYVKNDEDTVRKREERLKKLLEKIKHEVTYKDFKDAEELKAHVKDRLRALWHEKFKGKGKEFEKSGILAKFGGEKVLRKERSLKSEIFRQQGPLWIDFQEKKVATDVFKTLSTEQGEEVAFEELLNAQYALLLAPPASGKSVLLRYICYELCKQEKKVLFIELKSKYQKSVVEKIIEDSKTGKIEWSALENDIYFLIDDVHLDPNLSIEFFEMLNYHMDNPHIVMAGRDISSHDLDSLKREVRKMDGLEVKLDANVLSQSIYQHFIEIWNKENSGDLKVQYDDVSHYASDLWFFARALQAYAKGKRDEKGIFENLREDTLYYHEKAPCVLLALANFYAFELPVDELKFKEILLKNGLKSFLEVDYDELLNILIKNGVVLREMGYLWLPHSSLANLYIKSSDLTSFGSQIIDHFGRFGNKWRENLIRQYLLSEPINSGDFAIAFGSAEYYEDELAQAIMKSPEMDSLWVNAIRDIKIDDRKRRKNLGWASLPIRQIARYDMERARRIAERISYDEWYQRFIEENDLGEIGLTILRLTGTYPRLKEIIGDEKFIKVTTAKIKNIGDFNLPIAILIIALKLSHCERDILDRYVSAVNLPDMTKLKDLFSRMETLTDKAMILAAVHVLNNELGDRMYKEAKKYFEDSVQQLNCEDKTIFNDVGKAIFYIATFNQDFAEELIAQVNPRDIENNMRRYVGRIYIPGISILR
ncbi:DUF4062 domain-containing protein [Methanophagales archaeon]|nr:MAG: DUF4062 domain-containing protein [Methanophagales archaeon]